MYFLAVNELKLRRGTSTERVPCLFDSASNFEAGAIQIFGCSIKPETSTDAAKHALIPALSGLDVPHTET